MTNYKLIALIGEAGAGKDTIMQCVLQKNGFLNEIVSFTTRPPREGEKNGINYHFISHEDFTQKVLNDEMLEATCFNDWFYGTGYASLDRDRVNIGVFNPEGIDSIMAHKDIDIYVFYVRAADKVRLIRQLNREENPDVDEIIRRYKTDKSDFYDLDFHYNELWNNNEEDLTYSVQVIESAAKKLDKILHPLGYNPYQE